MTWKQRIVTLTPTVLLLAWSTPALAVDLVVTECKTTVDLHTVVHEAEVCDNDLSATSATVDFFFDRDTAPGSGESGDDSELVLLGGGNSCGRATSIRLYVPNGKYNLWCRANHGSESNPVNNLMGPEQYVVGPDLWVWKFWLQKDGNTTKYFATVCNTGSDVAYNFRVGFYYDRATYPGRYEYSDGFVAVESLAPVVQDYWFWPYWMCKEVEHRRQPTPDGYYTSWAKVDEGEFVEEGDEDNNWKGPIGFRMANPDLVVTHFASRVSTTQPYRVEYEVTVCNIGKGAAGVFWIDVYHDRDQEDAPRVGQPGDDNYKVNSLPPGACISPYLETDPERYYTFPWDNVPPTGGEKKEYESWVQADADEFVYDPNRATNVEGPLDVTVPDQGGTPGCPDQDLDGFGVGDDCVQAQDCNDGNASIYPGAPEECGDGIDQNCNITPDDGCQGVDCQDLDGDGWPSGGDCIIEDCDDNNPQRYPMAPEQCGDGIDNDCDGFVDDCCGTVDLCDDDGDGYCVGADCPQPHDCDDNNPAAGPPDGEEVCGDNADNDCDGLIDEDCPGTYCADVDKDGYGVGVGCDGPQDCNDNDASVHPGAAENCTDGVDQDCNGIINDGCTTCLDLDGDTYYVGDGANDNCQIRPKDCDESNPEIHPGAVEVCDGTDNNCNYSVDESSPPDPLCPDQQCLDACAGDPNCEALCGPIDCVDSDGDGWGVGPDCQVQDCNDDPGGGAIHPGQYEECDGIDNDCDGTVDDHPADDPCRDWACVQACANDPVCIESCPIVNCLDHDGDGWGVGPDCAVEDPDDTDPATWPGAPELCGDGVDQSGDGAIDEGCVVCVDHDGDGYGVGPYCAVRDCNDDNAGVHPGASERCGTSDLNCDGIAPVKDTCSEDCDCSHPGGSPRGHWPETALFCLILFALLRRRRRP